jgi:hypothetical protein
LWMRIISGDPVGARKAADILVPPGGTKISSDPRMGTGMLGNSRIRKMGNCQRAISGKAARGCFPTSSPQAVLRIGKERLWAHVGAIAVLTAIRAR